MVVAETRVLGRSKNAEVVLPSVNDEVVIPIGGLGNPVVRSWLRLSSTAWESETLHGALHVASHTNTFRRQPMEAEIVSGLLFASCFELSYALSNAVSALYALIIVEGMYWRNSNNNNNKKRQGTFQHTQKTRDWAQ